MANQKDKKNCNFLNLRIESDLVKSEPWTYFLERLGRHEPDALDLLADWSAKLMHVIRQNLDPRLVRRLDVEDILQSALRSFVRCNNSGQIRLTGDDHLLGLLVIISTRKCHRMHGTHFAVRRDIRRESQDAANLVPGQHVDSMVSREPSPLDAAILAETSEHIIDGLKSRERDVLMRLLSGQSIDDIAKELGRTHRTVRRTLANIREHFERHVNPLTTD